MTDRTDVATRGVGEPSPGWLRAVIMITLLFSLLVNARAAEPEFRLSSKKIREEVRAVVETQLAALRAGNFPAAYEMASRGIREQFDLQLFGVLMRRGYPTLLQAKSAELGAVRDKGGKLALVAVSMLDRQHRTIVYNFWLVEEPKGWRVNGVVLEQGSSRGEY